MPRIFQKARDPISSYSHFIGAALAIIGFVLMSLQLIWKQASVMTVVSTLLFCLSLVALYATSGIYHFSMAPAPVIAALRKLDHAMIYVLIAGSYTPMLLTLLPKPNNIIFTSVIWAIAILGIVLKLCWMNAPRWFGTTLYILMGWAIAVDLPALGALPKNALFLLAAGGVSYTIGGVIYMLKRPNFSDLFGFHELFHIFVLIGSILHYILVFWYIA